MQLDFPEYAATQDGRPDDIVYYCRFCKIYCLIMTQLDAQVARIRPYDVTAYEELRRTTLSRFEYDLNNLTALLRTRTRRDLLRRLQDRWEQWNTLLAGCYVGPVPAGAVESGTVSADQVATMEFTKQKWINWMRIVLGNCQREFNWLFTNCTEDDASERWAEVMRRQGDGNTAGVEERGTPGPGGGGIV